MSVMAATTLRRTTPGRSLEQRRAALARANDVRSARASFKRMLRFEPQRALEVLRDPPPEFEAMKVWDVLIALPKVGRVKVNKALNATKVSPSKTVGGLSQRQRHELLMWLRQWPNFRV